MSVTFQNKRIAEAFLFAIRAHGDQMYGDLPYFTHFLAVANAIQNPTEEETIAAFLHDVVEDTEVTLSEIAAIFGQNIADIVDLLTKTGFGTYEDAIDRIIDSGNRSAIKIKWADNSCNMSGDKSGMSAERRDRLAKKYTMSFNRLTDWLAEN